MLEPASERISFCVFLFSYYSCTRDSCMRLSVFKNSLCMHACMHACMRSCIAPDRCSLSRAHAHACSLRALSSSTFSAIRFKLTVQAQRLPVVCATVVPDLRFTVQPIGTEPETARSANATGVTQIPRCIVPDTLPIREFHLTRPCIRTRSKPARVRSRYVALNSPSSQGTLQICGNSPRSASRGHN